MSLAITRPGTGAHRADDVIAERDTRIGQLAADNQALIADSENNARDIHTALIRGCQDAIALAAALDENKQLKARVKELGNRVIRDGVNLERLRKAVVDARPRITYTVQALDRPYVSHVQIPYPVPTGRDMSNETTQEIAIVDLPSPPLCDVETDDRLSDEDYDEVDPDYMPNPPYDLPEGDWR